MKLASYSVELHPGWLVTETYDSAKAVTVIRCTNPNDSTKEFATFISHPIKLSTLDTTTWESIIGSVRAGYGDRNIGTLVLFDTLLHKKPVANEQLGRAEILANRQDLLEYAAIVVTSSESIMLTAVMPNTDYESRLSYIRSIASSIEPRSTR